MTPVRAAFDYNITGCRNWDDLSTAQQDEYLLGCFDGEGKRASLEKRFELFDRTASSIARGLLGVFYQYDVQIGVSHYEPESEKRARQVLNIRLNDLHGTILGERLIEALIRKKHGGIKSEKYDKVTSLIFYSVAPSTEGMLILDEACDDGVPFVSHYKGAWNDWTALEQLNEDVHLEILRNGGDELWNEPEADAEHKHSDENSAHLGQSQSTNVVRIQKDQDIWAYWYIDDKGKRGRVWLICKTLEEAIFQAEQLALEEYQKKSQEWLDANYEDDDFVYEKYDGEKPRVTVRCDDRDVRFYGDWLFWDHEMDKKKIFSMAIQDAKQLAIEDTKTYYQVIFLLVILAGTVTFAFIWLAKYFSP